MKHRNCTEMLLPTTKELLIWDMLLSTYAFRPTDLWIARVRTVNTDEEAAQLLNIHPLPHWAKAVRRGQPIMWDERDYQRIPSSEMMVVKLESGEFVQR